MVVAVSLLPSRKLKPSQRQRQRKHSAVLKKRAELECNHGVCLAEPRQRQRNRSAGQDRTESTWSETLRVVTMQSQT